MFWREEKNSFFSRVSYDFRFSRKMALKKLNQGKEINSEKKTES